MTGATLPPALVLLPEWGSGHLMSMLESCKRVLLHGGGRAFSIKLLVMRPPTAEATSEVEEHVRREAASGLDICFHRLPAVDPPRDAVGVEEFIARYVDLHAPLVRDAVAAMAPRPVAALVLDMFAAPMVDVARALGVPSYVFMSSTGAMLALMLHLPVFHEAWEGLEEVEDGGEEELLHVPGLPPLPPAAALPCPVVDRSSPNYAWFVRLGERFMDAAGIIANTADELEPGPLAAVVEGRCVPGRPTPPVYPIGPVLSLGSTKKRDDPAETPPHECVAWLDAQPPASVVFLCFGSMGWFEPPQVAEITAALERCGHRFLWVLRGPPTTGSGAGAPDGSEHPTDADLDALLPDGFLEGAKGAGLVWPSWAPQKDILAHPAVGGFVTHCGWNSVLESLWHGVPMAPWPLYAEQHLNAFELVAAMGVAVPLKVDRERDNFVEAAELERAVRSLMGGDETGRKAKEKAADMMAVCRKAVEMGGSSYAALQRLSAALHYGAAQPKKSGILSQ